MEYKGDEVIAFNLSQQMVTVEHFPLRGLTASFGAANPPLFIYLIALPALFCKNNPVIQTGFIAMLNLMAIAVSYLMIRYHLGRFEAIIATAFFAVSTWAIVFSRKLWAQNSIVLFSVLTLFFITKALRSNKKKDFLMAGLFSIILFQLHFSGLFILLAIAAIYFINKKSFLLRSFVKGALLGLVLLIPFMLHQFQIDFKDVRLIFNKIFQFSDPHRQFKLLYPFYSLMLVGGLKTYILLGFDYIVFLSSMPKWLHYLAYAVFAGEIGLIILGIYYSFKSRKNNSFYLINLLWFLVPTLLLSVTKIGDQPFYYLICFPSQFVLMAIALKEIKDNVLLKKITLLGIVVVLLTTIAFNFYLGQFIINKKTIKGDYGWAYREKMEFVKDLYQQAGLDEKKANSCRCLNGKNQSEVLELFLVKLGK
jgi:hypothetical protein